MFLDARVDREVCHLNLTPTGSTAVGMAIGYVLAAVWIERRAISPSSVRVELHGWIAGQTTHSEGGRPDFSGLFS